MKRPLIPRAWRERTALGRLRSVLVYLGQVALLAACIAACVAVPYVLFGGAP